MAEADVLSALTEQLCQLSPEDQFEVVKDALMSNLEVASSVVRFFKEFLSELPEAGDSDLSGVPPKAATAATRVPQKVVWHPQVPQSVATSSAPRTKTQGGPGALSWGFVASHDEEKGITVLSCPASEYGEEIAVPRLAAAPSDLPIDALVAFNVSLNAKGQPLSVGGRPGAIPVVWTLAGYLKDGESLPAAPFVGRVSGSHSNGMLFIDCPAVTAEFGRDAAAHCKVVEQCQLQEGDIVGFSVVENAAGKLWLSAPCWRCCSPNIQALPQPWVCTNPDQVPHAAIQPSLEPEPSLEPNSDELHLCVISSKQGQGCSLSCPDIEGEVWLDGKVAQSWQLSVGDGVACRVEGDEAGRNLRAIAPVWKRMGFAKDDEEAAMFGPFFGQLTGQPVGDVWYINSEQATATFGREAAAHAKVVGTCGLAGGDFIAFKAIETASGKVWMSAPCWKCCSQDQQSLTDFVDKWSAQEGVAPLVQAPPPDRYSAMLIQPKTGPQTVPPPPPAPPKLAVPKLQPKAVPQYAHNSPRAAQATTPANRFSSMLVYPPKPVAAPNPADRYKNMLVRPNSANSNGPPKKLLKPNTRW